VIKRAVVKLTATFFYSGLLPVAPGTWGSLFTLPVVYFLAMKNIDIIVFSFVIVVLFFIGWWAADGYDVITKEHDNKQIVIDEVVGQMITLLPVYYLNESSLLLYLIAFVLFRFFDITKVLGIKYLDREIVGGLGVMLDDVLAGVYAASLMYLIGGVII